jgi:hypothetical protein
MILRSIDRRSSQLHGHAMVPAELRGCFFRGPVFNGVLPIVIGAGAKGNARRTAQCRATGDVWLIERDRVESSSWIFSRVIDRPLVGVIAITA